MNTVLSFLKLNTASWTVRLGVLMSVLVAVAQVLPALQSVLHVVSPGSEAWLVVASMWVGRAIGFLKDIKAALPAETDDVGV